MPSRKIATLSGDEKMEPTRFGYMVFIPANAAVFCGFCNAQMELVYNLWASPHYRCTQKCEAQHPPICDHCKLPCARDRWGEWRCTAGADTGLADDLDDDIPV